MGIEGYLLSSAMIGVMAQRLVRTICPHCNTRFLVPPEIAKQYGWEEPEKIRLAKGRGCPDCYDSGYKGRTGIYEILPMDADLQKLIIKKPSRDELTRHLQEKNIKLLFQQGLEKVKAAITTIEEVLRVINP